MSHLHDCGTLSRGARLHLSRRPLRHASDNAPRVLRLSSPAQSATRKLSHHSAECRRFCADALIAALLHQSLCAYHCQKPTVASIPVSCVGKRQRGRVVTFRDIDKLIDVIVASQRSGSTVDLPTIHDTVFTQTAYRHCKIQVLSIIACPNSTTAGRSWATSANSRLNNAVCGWYVPLKHYTKVYSRGSAQNRQRAKLAVGARYGNGHTGYNKLIHRGPMSS